MTPQLIEEAIKRTRFRFSCEKDLQEGLSLLFVQQQIAFRREVDLGEHGRIDFLIDSDQGIGLEVKVDGSLTAVTRQIHRYAQSEHVGVIILVTSKLTHDHMPVTMNGKQVYVVPLIGSAF